MSFIGTQVKCKACEKTVYPVEQISADGVAYHKSCFKCSHCKGTLKVLISLFQKVIVALTVARLLGSRRCSSLSAYELEISTLFILLHFHVIGINIFFT